MPYAPVHTHTLGLTFDRNLYPRSEVATNCRPFIRFNYSVVFARNHGRDGEFYCSRGIRPVRSGNRKIIVNALINLRSWKEHIPTCNVIKYEIWIKTFRRCIYLKANYSFGIIKPVRNMRLLLNGLRNKYTNFLYTLQVEVLY